MDPVVLSAVIGGSATIVGGVLGAIVSRSEMWERLFARNRFPRLVGTRWESTWADTTVDGKVIPRKEIFEFTSQKRGRVYGYITMADHPDLKWEIEGIYNDRFLRLFWHPSTKAVNKFFMDCGCYFFKQQGLGSFKGYGVGFDAQQNKIDFGKHDLRQM